MARSLADELVDELEGFARDLNAGENIDAKYNGRTVTLNVRPQKYTPALVKKTRATLRASQAMFAGFLGVSVNTVSAWEQGSNPPQEIACRLMDEIRHDPTYWRNRLREMVVTKVPRRKKARA